MAGGCFIAARRNEYPTSRLTYRSKQSVSLVGRMSLAVVTQTNARSA